MAVLGPLQLRLDIMFLCGISGCLSCGSTSLWAALWSF